MHDHVDHSGAIINIQCLHPRFTAVSGLVNASFGTRAIQPSLDTDVDRVGIEGIDQNSTYLIAPLQPHVLPALAPVDRFIDPIAVRHRVTWIDFARSDPQHFLVFWICRDATDRNRCFTVKLMFDSHALIFGFKKTARCRGNPPQRWVFVMNDNVGDTTAHVGRSNRPPGDVF